MESSSSLSSSSLSVAAATADVTNGYGLSDSQSDNLKGILLAVVASAFIGSSFIVKKKGLKRAGSSGPRASVGGYGYLLEPLWWIGMVTMIVGEIANFVAYIFAPAVLVTPLGALSIIVSAVLADFLLNEKLQKMGILGCVLCIVGSTMIVLHAPTERSLNSVEEIWGLATQPTFLVYTAFAVISVLILMFHCAPSYGQTNILVYIGICSIIGSLTVIHQCLSVKTQTPSTSPSFLLKLLLPALLLSKNSLLFGLDFTSKPIVDLVMSVKAIGIAIKLTLEGWSQVSCYQTWIFAMVAITCVITQLNYLNKALDTFNTAVVSPIYYAMFTSLTILASAIMFKDYSGQSVASITSELCGFITVLSGTVVLHSTREPDPATSTDLYSPLSPRISWYIQRNGDAWKQRDEDGLSADFVAILRQDYFA